MSAGEYSHLFGLIDDELSKAKEKRQRLRDVDLFVLDNSIRESTVGQVRGHTLENKWGILDEVKKCGFKHIIVSAFAHATRVDDTFVSLLSERESDMSCYYAFTEIGEGKDSKDLPIGLKKMRQYKIQNPIIEMDMGTCYTDEKEEKAKKRLQRGFDYAHEHLSSNPKIFVNIRDLAVAMTKHPVRVFNIVKFMGTLPPERRPFGLMFEEPTGRFIAEQLGGWTRSLRQLMDDCDWKDGKLLVHVHEKWSNAEVIQLECIACGANGIWASVCEEGAAMGHACSTVSIMNLVRFGNKKVLEKFNCTYLRDAAIKVTEITTGSPPFPKQPVYGAHALDIVFDASGGMGGGDDTDMPAESVSNFDLAKFFHCKAPVRVSTLATSAMIKDRLIELFGENEDFTEERATKMKAVMIEDLTENRKREYMSPLGILSIYVQAGGIVDPKQVLGPIEEEMVTHAHQLLLKGVREIWDEWDTKEEESLRGDDCLEYYSFYNGFLARYIATYESDDLRRRLKAVQLMSEDNKIHWYSFGNFLKYVLKEYPEVATVTELLDTAFQKSAIPTLAKLW